MIKQTIVNQEIYVNLRGVFDLLNISDCKENREKFNRIQQLKFKGISKGLNAVPLSEAISFIKSKNGSLKGLPRELLGLTRVQKETLARQLGVTYGVISAHEMGGTLSKFVEERKRVFFEKEPKSFVLLGSPYKSFFEMN